MASYTIDIPEQLHREIQERRHQIDVSDICTQALSAAISSRPCAHAFGTGHEETQAINRMFAG